MANDCPGTRAHASSRKMLFLLVCGVVLVLDIRASLRLMSDTHHLGGYFGATIFGVGYDVRSDHSPTFSICSTCAWVVTAV